MTGLLSETEMDVNENICFIMAIPPRFKSFVTSLVQELPKVLCNSERTPFQQKKEDRKRRGIRV